MNDQSDFQSNLMISNDDRRKRWKRIRQTNTKVICWFNFFLLCVLNVCPLCYLSTLILNRMWDIFSIREMRTTLHEHYSNRHLQNTAHHSVLNVYKKFLEFCHSYSHITEIICDRILSYKYLRESTKSRLSNVYNIMNERLTFISKIDSKFKNLVQSWENLIIDTGTRNKNSVQSNSKMTFLIGKIWRNMKFSNISDSNLLKWH